MICRMPRVRFLFPPLLESSRARLADGDRFSDRYSGRCTATLLQKVHTNSFRLQPSEIFYSADFSRFSDHYSGRCTATLLQKVHTNSVSYMSTQRVGAASKQARPFTTKHYTLLHFPACRTNTVLAIATPNYGLTHTTCAFANLTSHLYLYKNHSTSQRDTVTRATQKTQPDSGHTFGTS